MKRKLLLKILILTILAGTLMGRGRIGENEDFAHGGKGSTEIKEETLYDDGNTSYLFRVEGKYFQKYDGSEFKDYYIKGVNIGSSKPNTFPGELGVTQDAFSDIKDVKKDLRDLVNIIHGNAKVEKRVGHAYGNYTRDISKYVIGWILGIESDQSLVEGTRDANKHVTSYSGDYLSCEKVEPYEVFWCEIGDYALKYEDEKYHMQRPVSYSNWPTADVMKHPNEPLSKEDAISLTVDDLNAQNKFKTGIFASYHVYSYYPNFMFSEEPYCSYKDESGKINTYLGYLKNLIAHNKCPVLIAEFGIPASRGVTHVNPITGFNQGGVSARQQGEMLVSMFKDIKKSKCAGGLVFVWEDEWFKRTWNTMDYTNSDYRAYWNDVQTSEQHFGLAEYISTECDLIPVLDGELDEWSKKDIIFEKNDTKIYVKCDSTYVYIAIQDKKADFDKKGNNLYFDINPNTGCGNYGDIKLSSDADFILHIEGKNKTRLLVDPDSDSYVRAEPDWEKLNLVKDKKDSFHRIYLITDKSLLYPQTKKRLPVQKSETGLLHFGKVDVDDDIGDVLTDFYYKKHVFEVRIPWGLLGFSAPSVKEINYSSKNTTLKVDGINIGYISANKNIGEKQFKWDSWEHASYRHHLRQSYYILQEYLETIDTVH
ncbi:putative uncharacterized protein [Clostridium sp. CAG:253]|nr:putative uncharacterized protein [Clostridium sp. CAG:253]